MFKYKYLKCFILIYFQKANNEETSPTTTSTRSIISNDNKNSQILLCYLSYLFNKRGGIANLTIESIQPYLCTHLVYSMAKIDDKTYDNLVPFGDDNNGISV
jgi:hypothetical protein